MQVMIDCNNADGFGYASEDIFGAPKGIASRLPLWHDFRFCEFCTEFSHVGAEGYV